MKHQSIYLNVLIKDKGKIEDKIKNIKKGTVIDKHLLNELTNELDFIYSLIVAENRRIKDLNNQKEEKENTKQSV